VSFVSDCLTGIQELLADAENRDREDAAISIEMQGQIKVLIYVSFAEIYNEQVFDLLEPLPKKKNARRHILQLREDKNGTPYIKGQLEMKYAFL
jgi:kinesin family protein 20